MPILAKKEIKDRYSRYFGIKLPKMMVKRVLIHQIEKSGIILLV